MSVDAALTGEQLARVLGKSPQWVRKHLRELPHYKIGRDVSFDPADLPAIKARYRVEPAVAQDDGADALRPVGRGRAETRRSG